MDYTNIDASRAISANHFLDSKDLKELALHDHFPSVSIYIPTFRKGTEVKQNSVQLEKGMKDAIKKLVDIGMQENFAKQFLQPVLDLTKDYNLMQHLYEGTAIFVSLSEVRLFTLPCPFTPEVSVDNVFDLRQLMICETNNAEFYVLHITENSVSLYKGDTTELIEVEVPTDIPQSMDERFDLEERGIQIKSRPVPTDGGAIMRGNTPLKDIEDRYIRKFVQDVEKGLTEKVFPPNSNRPLILVGSPTITAIYKEVTNNPNIISETISGNYEQTNKNELHAKAIDTLRPWQQSQIDTVINRYLELKGQDITSSNIAAILPAVYSGAVDTLLIADNAEYKGEYDLHTNKLDVRSQTDHDIINDLIVQTLLQSGKVLVIPRERMPGKNDAVAIFRFPVPLSAT